MRKKLEEILEPMLIDLERHVDDRGYLNEIYRSDEFYFTSFGQVYLIDNPRRGVIRGYHLHKKKDDFWFVVDGSAKVLLKKNNIKKSFVLTYSKPQLLIIPKGWWHAWMSLEDNTKLINIVSKPFDGKDDYRSPANKKEFEVKIR